jgi:hypothetical protein
MGSLLSFCRSIKLCFGTSYSTKMIIVPGLCAPDGKLIQAEGLHIDFTVKEVYKSRLILIEFASSLSGKQCQVSQCLYVSKLPLTARVEEMKETFKNSTRNVLYIEKDNKYFYEGKVTVLINDVTYDLGEYLSLREFSRFPTISRPTSPKHHTTPVIPGNFLVRIDLDKQSIPDEEFIHPIDKISFGSPVSVNIEVEPGLEVKNDETPKNKFVSISKGAHNFLSPANEKGPAHLLNPADSNEMSEGLKGQALPLAGLPLEISSPKNEHVERSIDNLQIIENKF